MRSGEVSMGGGKRKQRKRSSGNKGKKQKVVGDDSEKIQKLLEPYSKEQVMEFLCDAAVGDSSVLERIQSMADQDVSHRKIFVHGLAWNTTSETLYAAFDSYGEIQECNLVVDRATGRAKGYGFILYKTRSAAKAALEQPQKNINNRITHCQLASAGPLTTTSSSSSNNDNTARKIYVSNVHADVNPDKLRTFFSKFGDIEMGPLGFDTTTGKSRGFALFIYKTIDAANKAIEEPYKMFQGHQLHCQRASDNKNKNKASLPHQPPPVLAAIAAAQNLAIFQHHPSLNPVYASASASHGLGILGGNPSIYGAYTTTPSLQQPTNTSLTGYPSYI